MANEHLFENDPGVLEDLELVRAVGLNPNSLGIPFGPLFLSWAIEDDAVVKERHERSGYAYIDVIRAMNEPDRAALRERLESDSHAQMVFERHPEARQKAE
jgi:hypothetical protein